jgi:MoaA/NifB/PqqE/SkfB family radical SAM enzyme
MNNSNRKIWDSLENIYISPFERCNLNCKFCYTKKTKNVLGNNQILSFVDKYKIYLKSKKHDLKSILFCGGELFLSDEFIDLVNVLDGQNIFVSVITNGTIDKLKEIKNPNNCQLLVSLDGPREIHDKNRGLGNFDKTINFIKNGLKLGFHMEIMFLVTPESFPFVDTFFEYISNIFKSELNINYITQKTIFYTANHPLSNQENKKVALTKEQIIKIKKDYSSIPSKNFGCFQLALQSNGLVYGCCESPTPIAKISDDVEIIINSFSKSLKKCFSCSVCGGCCNPDFICGYKKELSVISCQEVVKLFNDNCIEIDDE